MPEIIDRQFFYEKREQHLNERGYGVKQIEDFRKKIKKVSPEEALELSRQIERNLKIAYSQTLKPKKKVTAPVNPVMAHRIAHQQVLIDRKNDRIYDKEDIEENLKETENLIMAGADLEYKYDDSKDTHLIYCSRCNLYYHSQLFIKGGADINARNYYLSTATMFSAKKGYNELLIDLNLLGANINLQCKDGDAALHSAAHHNQIKSGLILIYNNAFINILNNKGQSPIAIARDNKFDEFANMLASYLALSDSGDFVPEYTEELVRDELNKAKEKLKTLQS